MELPSLRAYLFSALWTYRFPNLPYRRFPIGRTVASSEALEAAKRLRVGNPRYSRFGNLLQRGRHAKHIRERRLGGHRPPLQFQSLRFGHYKKSRPPAPTQRNVVATD